MTEVNQLSALIRNIELNGIKLAETECKNFPRELGESGEINVQLKWSAKAVLRSAEAFSVLAEIEALLTPSSGEADGARIWARFELRYSLRAKTDLNEGLLEEFAKTNGVFNAWSYWREFVQGMLLRMELPPVILPLYRMQTPAPSAPQEKSKAR